MRNRLPLLFAVAVLVLAPFAGAALAGDAPAAVSAGISLAPILAVLTGLAALVNAALDLPFVGKGARTYIGIAATVLTALQAGVGDLAHTAPTASALSLGLAALGAVIGRAKARQ